MNKSELYEKLKKTYNLFCNIDSLKNKNQLLSTSKWTTHICVEGSIIFVISYIIYVLWYASSNTSNLFWMLILGLPVGIVVGIFKFSVIAIIFIAIGLILNKLEFKKNAKEIKENNFQIKMIYHDIERSNIVPSKYCNRQYVGKFIQYLDNLRADTLKECINLLENEISHKEKMRIMKQNQKMLQKIRDITLDNQNSIDNINRKIY